VRSLTYSHSALVIDHSLRFLYIDLFIIIPIAIASTFEFIGEASPMSNTSFSRSGKNLALSPNRPQKTDVKSGFQKGVDQYHRSDTHQLLHPNLRVLLGQGAEMVSTNGT
jgi:hypothetical protein